MNVNKLLDSATLEFKDAIMKAAETISTSTFSPEDRSVFSPENLDEQIKILVPTGTPLRNRIPRVPGKGQATAWKRLTSSLQSGSVAGGASGTGQTVFFADAGEPNETSQTYDTVSAAYKLLGRKVEVGGLANAASRGGQGGSTTMLEHREKIKLYEVMLGEEEALINGDATSQTLAFDGLLTQITTYSGSMSLLTVSGINVYLETLADVQGAYPDLLLAQGRQIRALADELQGSGSISRIVYADNRGNATGGIALKSFINSINGSQIEVEHSKYLSDNALLLTTKSEAGENWIEIEDLIPMSRVDVPSSNFSYIRFIVEAMVLKVIGEPFQYKIQGLAT